jgi:arabinan endo-1,5-alpha-L-arabinosidase
MRRKSCLATLFIALSSLICMRASAQLAGVPYIHDPSTIAFSDGKYYTFGTGGGGLISDDGFTWRGGAVRPGGGVAPDVIKIDNRYYVAYAVGGGGMSGGHASNVKIMWTKTLNPQSPDFKFNDVGVVASSDGIEDCDAIDPAFLYAQGHLWLSYGTYFGYIRIIELDPKSGMRLPENKPVNVAIDMEATDLMYRDGWYYLLGTHGTCCDGPNSTYNIRVGRSKNPTGPYLDQMGIPLLKGGGKLVVAASGRHYGPGHFGLLDLGDDVQKFSMHYEADMDRGGRSVLDIRPLLWKDGWPVGGENFEGGTYEIQSARSGGALELATDFVRIALPRGSFGFGPPTGPISPIATQTLVQDQAVWPKGNIPVDMSDYMVRPHQIWKITPMPKAGGYPGSSYFKITIDGTERALEAGPEGTVITAPLFIGTPEQLWRIDQLIDGTYRIMPKSASSLSEPRALTAIGASTPALSRFDPSNDRSKWNFNKP